MAKKSTQKFKYLENEKNLENEIRAFFFSFLKSFFIEANKPIFFLDSESPTVTKISNTLGKVYMHIYIFLSVCLSIS